MPGKIFVNYRRDDSAANALSVAQYLEREFGARNVFLDIDRMRAGQNFPEVLREKLSKCNVMVAVIGPAWLTATSEDGRRRIDDPEDWVRLEITSALERGIAVIPVVVGGAKLPRKSDLPEALQPLLYRQVATITTNGFRHEMAGLVGDIRSINSKDVDWRRVGIVMSVVATLCAIAFAAAYHLNLFAQPDLHTWDSGTRSPVESGDSKSGKSLIMGGEHNSAQSDAIQSSTTQLAAGSSFSDCPSLCPEMVVIPAGEFLMGSSAEEAARGSNEGPQHAVELGRPIAVGKYEIKFSEWDLCVVEGGCLHKPDDEGEGRANRPVYNVSWNDVQQYVSWLRKKTGRNYRLLSEAEWEYAARAGSLTPFSTGQKIAMSEANFDWNYTGGAAHATATRQMALDAGSFKPNAFGLYDMHGNVWEWTQDCYEESYQSAPVDGSAKTSGDCSGRVVRGGAWSSDSGYLRSATRFKYSPDSRGNDTGFRVARSFE